MYVLALALRQTARAAVGQLDAVVPGAAADRRDRRQRRARHAGHRRRRLERAAEQLGPLIRLELRALRVDAGDEHRVAIEPEIEVAPATRTSA